MAPPCGELKSKKVTTVTETQGGDKCGGQMKVKSEPLVKKVALPCGELTLSRIPAEQIAEVE